MNYRNALRIMLLIITVLIIGGFVITFIIQRQLPQGWYTVLVVLFLILLGSINFLGSLDSTASFIQRIVGGKPSDYQYRYFDTGNHYYQTDDGSVGGSSRDFINGLELSKRNADLGWELIRQDSRSESTLRQINDYVFHIYREFWFVQRNWRRVNGRYFQGKLTMSKPPKLNRDGKVELGFGLTDQVEDWRDIGYQDEYAPVQLLCHVYDGPEGQGFTVWARVRDQNVVYKNQMHWGGDQSKSENNYLWRRDSS